MADEADRGKIVVEAHVLNVNRNSGQGEGPNVVDQGLDTGGDGGAEKGGWDGICPQADVDWKCQWTKQSLEEACRRISLILLTCGDVEKNDLEGVEGLVTRLTNVKPSDEQIMGGIGKAVVRLGIHLKSIKVGGSGYERVATLCTAWKHVNGFQELLDSLGFITKRSGAKRMVDRDGGNRQALFGSGYEDYRSSVHPHQTLKKSPLNVYGHMPPHIKMYGTTRLRRPRMSSSAKVLGEDSSQLGLDQNSWKKDLGHGSGDADAGHAATGRAEAAVNANHPPADPPAAHGHPPAARGEINSGTGKWANSGAASHGTVRTRALKTSSVPGQAISSSSPLADQAIHPHTSPIPGQARSSATQIRHAKGAREKVQGNKLTSEAIRKRERVSDKYATASSLACSPGGSDLVKRFAKVLGTSEKFQKIKGNVRGEGVDNEKRSVGGDRFLAFLEEEAVIPALVTRREAAKMVLKGQDLSLLLAKGNAGAVLHSQNSEPSSGATTSSATEGSARTGEKASTFSPVREKASNVKDKKQVRFSVRSLPSHVPKTNQSDTSSRKSSIPHYSSSLFTGISAQELAKVSTADIEDMVSRTDVQFDEFKHVLGIIAHMASPTSLAQLLDLSYVPIDGIRGAEPRKDIFPFTNLASVATWFMPRYDVGVQEAIMNAPRTPWSKIHSVAAHRPRTSVRMIMLNQGRLRESHIMNQEKKKRKKLQLAMKQQTQKSTEMRINEASEIKKEKWRETMRQVERVCQEIAQDFEDAELDDLVRTSPIHVSERTMPINPSSRVVQEAKAGGRMSAQGTRRTAAMFGGGLVHKPIPKIPHAYELLPVILQSKSLAGKLGFNPRGFGTGSYLA